MLIVLIENIKLLLSSRSRCCDEGYMEVDHNQPKITCTANPTVRNSMNLDTKIQANIGCDVPFDVKNMHGFGENSLDTKLNLNVGRLDSDGTYLTLSHARSDNPNMKGKKNLTIELNVDSYCVRISIIS